jgi:gamma-glutamyltranspeptidase/glutathione hydrolase
MRSRQIIDRTEVVAENGIVTAMHPLAAETGIEILAMGGNAVDAAVAAGFTVGVVEPFMSGLGGAAYAMVYDAASDRTLAIDGCVQIPEGACEDMFELLDENKPVISPYGWRPVRNNASESGVLSVLVPGAVATYTHLLKQYGTLPLKDVLAPAIRLAEEGFIPDWYVFANFALEQARLREFPETAAVFYQQDGTPYLPHFIDGPRPQKLVQSDLARTLRTISRDGADSFYQGQIAQSITAYIQAHGGILTEQDLADYQVRVREPLSINYRGNRITMIPENSGGPTVGEALNILEGFELSNWDYTSSKALHVIIEALRMAFGDRYTYLGDMAFNSIPLEGLQSKAYASSRRGEIQLKGDRVSQVVGDPWSYVPGGRSTLSPTGHRPGPGRGHTTHLTVIDRHRNMVSLTASLGYLFGSGVTVPGTGVVLNNGMMWFNPEPGHINSINPGKHALHAGTPTLVFDDQGPNMAIGAPGGRAVITAITQVIVNVLDHGMNMQKAISSPRIHVEGEHQPVLVDGRFPPETIEQLGRQGHNLTLREENVLSYYFARPNGVLVDRERGVLRGGVTPYQVSTGIGF